MAKQTHQTRNLAIIGTIIAAVIILPVLYSVVGSLFSVYTKGSVPIPTSNPLSISEAQSWQVYTNEEAGFSISYPPEMYPADTPYQNFAATFLISDLREFEIDMEIQPRIDVYKSDLPAAQLLQEANEGRSKDQFPQFSEIENTKYDTYETKPYDQEVIFYHTIIGTDEKSYLIDLFTIEKDNDAIKEVYEKMLASFVILENE